MKDANLTAIRAFGLVGGWNTRVFFSQHGSPAAGAKRGALPSSQSSPSTQHRLSARRILTYITVGSAIKSPVKSRALTLVRHPCD